MLYSLHFQHKQRAQCSAQSPALAGDTARAGEGKGSPAPAPLPGGGAPRSLTSHTPALLPSPESSTHRGMRSKSSRGSTGDGGKPLSSHGEQRRAAPAFLLQLERGRGMHLHTRARVESPSLIFCPSSSCLPEGSRERPGACCCLRTPGRSGAGMEASPSV